MRAETHGAGIVYAVEKVTPFGNKSWLLDLGTTQYQVFLDLKRLGKKSLEQTKALVMEIVVEPNGMLSDR